MVSNLRVDRPTWSLRPSGTGCRPPSFGIAQRAGQVTSQNPWGLAILRHLSAHQYPVLSVSPEYDLVRLAARSELAPERAAKFRSAVLAGPDWSEVLRIASYHRLFPLLSSHLRAHAADAVPEHIADTLQQYLRFELCYVLLLSTEMARVGSALDAHHIPHLVLKGPSLAEAYGSTSKRLFVDNDILIDPKHLAATSNVLSILNFNYKKRSILKRRGYINIHGEESFSKRVGNLISTVDLHISIAPFGYSYNESFEYLYSRSRPLDIAGHTSQALSWGDLFLALCVNALKDQWNRLRIATDLAEIVPYVESWDLVERVARKNRSSRVLHIGILVAAESVGGDFPPDLLHRARQDAGAVDIAERIQVHLAMSYQHRIMDTPERARLVLSAQDNPVGQLQYLAYVALRRLTERFIDPEGWVASRARHSPAPPKAPAGG
jgi:hypothetical protein